MSSRTSLRAAFVLPLFVFLLVPVFVVGEEQGGAVGSPSLVDASARVAGVTENWLSAVKDRIAREEYCALVSDLGLQAPNRAHDLRTYFRDGGIEVVPRTGEGEETSWRFTWCTVRWGREGDLVDVGSSWVEPVANGSRVTYARGGLDEWYDNKKEGIEQGFTIRERPAGEGALVIEGVIGGTVRGEFSADAEAIDLLNANGARVLRYAELVVRDAAGAEVSSHMNLEGEVLALVVDDALASYPLAVDPLMTSPAWTGEGDQGGAEFGISVATAGDVDGDGFSDVVVGAPSYDNGQVEEGRAFVYHGSPAGLSVAASWTAEGDQVDANFGESVGPAGDVNGDGYSDVVVGADYYTNGEYGEGRAYVYHGSSSGLSSSAAWTAECNQAIADFGGSVGTAGDVNEDGYSDVIVGARNYDNGETNEGRAFVYHGSASGLSASAAWTAESNQASAYFGSSVGTAGDVNGDGYSDVIVGATGYDNGQSSEGRAFAYHGSSGGLSMGANWTAESNQASASFGISVGTAGDVNGDGYSDVVVGAYQFDGGQSDEGRAYVYYGSSGGPSVVADWVAESNQASAWFGYSVGTAGDVNGDGFSEVIVGAREYHNGQTGEGRAYIYYGSIGELSPDPSWIAESNQEGACFGTSVGTAGDVNGDGFSDVIVGASRYDNGEATEGRAFVYHGSGDGLPLSAGWTQESGQASASFGISVGTAGDVNGDGYSDVVVGAYQFDGGQSDEGRAYVYHGSSGGPSVVADWTAESNQASAWFGYSVGTAGDVNGDGYSDVIVGAHQFSNGQSQEGRAYVYPGSSSGLSGSASWTAESDEASGHFGISVGTAGDVNGDGYSDVVVGARHHQNGQAFEGGAYVYQGSSGGLPASASWTAESDQAYAYFGSSVGTAGDVNGDGFSDVIVGALGYDNGESGEGRAFVYHGSSGGLSTDAGWTAESNQAGASFGISVGTAGDVNGDGFSDVIVGAHQFDNGESNEGGAWVYHGSSTGLASGPARILECNQADANFGSSVGTAGDVNGDGYSDVIVGARLYDSPDVDGGGAFAYLGSSAGLSAGHTWRAESDENNAHLGSSVGTAGDVNGDGFSDVIVGASHYDNGQSDEGRAFLYYGNGGDGLHRIPRQARTDDSAPIALLGVSDEDDGFRLEVLGRTPVGRGDVRMQYEVKPLGTAFDGSGLVTGSWTNTGAPSGGGSSVALSELATGLDAETLYHWRLRTQSDSPFFPRSPWFSLPYNCVTEADVRTAISTGVAGESEAPRALMLSRATPNPFGTSMTVSYALPARGHVRLSIYNVAGREVAVLVDGPMDAGPHGVSWDGTSAKGAKLPAGVYFARLAFAGRDEARKIVLTR